MSSNASAAADLPVIDNRWVLSRREPLLNPPDPAVPYDHQVEPERTAAGRIEDVLTIFITNRTCPFRCLMCDLWKYTTPSRVPVGDVAGQVRQVLAAHAGIRHVKLYNAGNFFDNQAISPRDREEISEALDPLESVIIECHPRLVDRRTIAYAKRLSLRLEVAMGLETVDPAVLPRLNKGMSLDDFDRSCAFLLKHGITVRAFILLRAPFQTESEGLEWTKRSIDHALSIGVTCCSVVPTRAGNGAMDELQARGLFFPPSIDSIERAQAYGILAGQASRARVFVDLWDIERFATCQACRGRRVLRMQQMNLAQDVRPNPTCPQCERRAQS